jgi:hypothetical protein
MQVQYENQSDDHLSGVGEEAPKLGEVPIDPLPAPALGLAVATRRRQRLGVHQLLRRHPTQLSLQAAQQPRDHRFAAPLRRAMLAVLPLMIKAEAEHAAVAEVEPSEDVARVPRARDAAKGPHGRIGKRRGAEPGPEPLMVRGLLVPVFDASVPHGWRLSRVLLASARWW